MPTLKWLTVAACYALLGGCVSNSPAFNSNGNGEEEQPRRIMLKIGSPCPGFSAEGMNTYYEGGEISFQRNHRDVCKPLETGEINGVAYTIHHEDGSASFYNETPETSFRPVDEKWHVSCKDDAMTDVRSCSMSRSGFFLLYQDSFYINVGHETYPGTSVMFRVDGSQAFVALEDSGLSGRDAEMLVAQIKEGSVLNTRHYSWPHHLSVDNKISTNGFREALDYLLSLRQR